MSVYFGQQFVVIFRRAVAAPRRRADFEHLRAASDGPARRVGRGRRRSSSRLVIFVGGHVCRSAVGLGGRVRQIPAHLPGHRLHDLFRSA
ncbi:MAG: hypothetical protein H6669_15855 [Ardenticatenaceae bacterium]|nr:hypothetical protein [Ardenticatenaceae bacterium]